MMLCVQLMDKQKDGAKRPHGRQKKSAHGKDRAKKRSQQHIQLVGHARTTRDETDGRDQATGLKNENNNLSLWSAIIVGRASK